MSLEDLVSHAATRWATPPALFAAVYTCFAFLDDKIAPEFRDSLVAFVRGGQYKRYIEVFPEFIQEIFERVFGKTHLSLFCIRRSIIFSVGSVLLTVLFSILYQPNSVFGIIPAWAQFWDSAGLTLAKDERLAALAKDIQASWKYIVPMLLAGGWLVWCLVPDYLALLRVRVIVLVMRYTKPSVWTLLIVAAIDFLVGIWIFLASFTFIQALVLVGLFIGSDNAAFHYDGISSIAAGVITWNIILFAFEFLIFAPTGFLFVTVPIGNLFWASMLPSLWLWIFILASLVSRLLYSSRSIFHGVFQMLDVKDHPIRSLGIVAAAIIAGLDFIFLILLSIF